MFVWVTLPGSLGATELLAKSIRTAKVAFVPGKAFFADGSGDNTILLSFSCADQRLIEDGISRLGKLIQAELA